MTDDQKQLIVRLRNIGIGYKKIGIALDILWDIVVINAGQKAYMDTPKDLLRTRMEMD